MQIDILSWNCSLTLPFLFEVYDKFLSFSNHRFPFFTWLYTFFNFSDVPKHAKTQKIDRVSTKCDKVNQTNIFLKKLEMSLQFDFFGFSVILILATEYKILNEWISSQRLSIFSSLHYM